MSFKLIKIVVGRRRMCGGSHLKINCARPTLRTAEPSSIYISLQTYLAKVMSSDRPAQGHRKINSVPHSQVPDAAAQGGNQSP